MTPLGFVDERLQMREEPAIKSSIAIKEIHRFLALFSLLLLAFFFLLIRFLQLQVIQQDKWQNLANRQHLLAVDEKPRRGSIVAQTLLKNHPSTSFHLAIDLQAYHLQADCRKIPSYLKPLIAKSLCSLLHLDEKNRIELLQRLFVDSRNRRILEEVDSATQEKIQTYWRHFSRRHKLAANLIFFEKSWRRHYPHGSLFGQTLQTVQKRRDEKTLQAQPLGGIELACDALLSPQATQKFVARSPRHKFAYSLPLSPPKDGCQVNLTIDPVIQAIAEEEIERGVKRAGAESGLAIMLDPFNGNILAMAQYPFYNPQLYSLYWQNLSLREHSCLKFVTQAYEPGSVVKPITLALALLANQLAVQKGATSFIDPEAAVNCLPRKFTGRSKPVKDVRDYRKLNMDMALQRSSNVYFAVQADNIIKTQGSQWYSDCLKRIFGLGVKCGLGLPGESCGFVPTPNRYYPSGRPQWSAAAPYSLAMGYNLQATPIQLVRAFAVFANGGYLVQPRLWSEPCKEPPSRVLPADIVARVVTSMKYGTKPGGSVKRADINGYTEAAKSGTSEKVIKGSYSKTRHRSATIGMAPLNHPAFVLYILIDDPAYAVLNGIGRYHHGGGCAAPVFSQIGRRVLHYLGITPDDPFGYPLGDPRRDASRADWLLETERLQKLFQEWNGS